MIKPVLDLKNQDDAEFIKLLKLVATEMAKDTILFSAPTPALQDLTDQAGIIENLIDERASLLSQAQALTIQIRDARNVGEAMLNTEAAYVDKKADGNAADIAKAGMTPSSDSHGRVGPMPKVTALVLTQGDADGEIDAQWHPVKRGLLNYTLEITEDPAGLTGWRYFKNASKSSTALPGLVSGKRYWVRVIANGSAGPGPASDPATKVAP